MCRAWILTGILLGAALAYAADDALGKARRQFDAGDYPGATATLQTALAQAPRDAPLYYWLARCAYELGDFNTAAAQAQRAIQLDPQNSDYHLWLGRAYGEKADRERSFSLARKTKSEFEEAVRLNPGNIPARRDLMEYYVEASWIVGGSKDKAQQQVEAIAALDAVAGHLARADYWRYQKKPELAEAEYRQVLELKPNRAEPYLEVADFYQRRKVAARMEAAVEAAARVDPSNPQLLYYCGVVRVLAGNHLPQAEQFLKSYLAEVPQRSDLPSHASALEWLGRLYEQMGKRDQAAQEYRAALQLEPGNKSAREGLRRMEKRP